MPVSRPKGLQKVVYAHLLYTSHKEPVEINEENQDSCAALHLQ